MKIAEQEEREQRRMDIAATKEVCVRTYVAVCCDRHSILRGLLSLTPRSVPPRGPVHLHTSTLNFVHACM